MSDADDRTCARFALGEFSVPPRSLPDERPPGLLAGRYEVGRLIGSGGTARVYRAYDLRLAREVAVKIYDRDAVALDQRRRLREMTIQGSIAHPGVVALLDSGTEHGRTYLVMQLVEGENLAERLLGGPMPAAEVITLADGLAEALAHVHALRVVHRDLKPANVFLSADGPLIGDFGIAHALDTTHITGTGVVPGTAAYLAPEQVGGEPAGPPADVYALGLILLECVTGRREYLGTMVEAAMARLTRPPRIPEGLPPSLAYTLHRMTQREPSARPTATEVRQLLHAPAPSTPRWTSATASGEHDLLGAVRDAGWTGTAANPGHHDRPGTTASDLGEIGTGQPGHHQRLWATESDSSWTGTAQPGHHDRPGTTASDLGAIGIGARASGEPGRIGAAAGRRRTGDHPGSGTTGRGFDRTAGDTREPHRILGVLGLSPASDPAHRRRFTTAAGLTAAAVVAVSAMLLSAQEPGTTPAQPPVANSPVPTSSPASSAPLAESGTPAPGSTESASLEPAAVTSRTQAPPASKPGKPPKTPPPGKGKGKGHDS
ncbi:Serine/threonine protein kinase [Amycolatopsis australiensis]|uniref:non-specific serine/threonine protein kinase n=2 Tax=Amycolatopsis australiensis TaxID=546364 RepID=A0A1K1ST36_9PSEU|nr:Serine/threonine protein kinase [Amycolatopsis australiensis]